MLNVTTMSDEELNQELDSLYSAKKSLMKDITNIEDKTIEIKEELLKRKNKLGWGANKD